MRRKKQHRDPRDVRQAYPSERGRSPYWEWASRHCPTDEAGHIIEPRGANDAQTPYPEAGEPSPEMAAIVAVLNENGLGALTVRQRRAVKLVLIAGMTYKRAARLMGISPMVVHKHVKSGAKRLRKLAEEKLR